MHSLWIPRNRRYQLVISQWGRRNLSASGGEQCLIPSVNIHHVSLFVTYSESRVELLVFCFHNPHDELFSVRIDLTIQGLGKSQTMILFFEIIYE